MNPIQALPSLAVFQGSIMKDFVRAALECTDPEKMREHVQQIERQLGEFVKQACRAVAEQNGDPLPPEE